MPRFFSLQLLRFRKKKQQQFRGYDYFYVNYVRYTLSYYLLLFEKKK